MDVQVENAVGIAWDPSSDQALKVQAFDFLNQLRSISSGRQACVALFTRSPKCSDVVRLVSLDVINNAIQSQQLDFQSLEDLRENFLEYVKRVYGSGNQDSVDPTHLQNKLTQTLTLLFVATYTHGWSTFFDDFLGLTSFQNNNMRNNVTGTMLYLRTLSSIHDQIADVIISRTNEETRMNSELKDTIRSRDVSKVVLSWQEILSYWQGQNDAVVETCLKVIGKWASWIDISLIMDQSLLRILYQIVGRTHPRIKEDKIRNTAIETFTEIVAKKMKAPEKIAMIVFLNLGEVISQLIATPPLNELRTTSSYDTDLAETVAKLVNNVISDIVKVLEDPKRNTEVQMQAEQLLQTFLPLLLRFLSDEYDEICSTVIPSLTDLLTFLRKAKSLPNTYTGMLTPILNTIIQKMRYDETSSWGKEDERTDEAEFQELRKRLQGLQKIVAAVDENLYIEIISHIISNIFETFLKQNGQMDWRDLDLALYEMYLFGEVSLSNCGLYSKGQPSCLAAVRLIAMISKMIDSGIASFNHPAVQLQYMEICVRYSSFFENQKVYIPHVLEQFVRFVHHEHIKVRTRSWYLFHRFVKQLRIHIGNIAETVIHSISDLLSIKAELPEATAADDISSDENDRQLDANFDAQLYLFEAIGCISSTTVVPVEKQVLYVRTITNSIFSEIQRDIVPAKSGNPQSILQIHHLIKALGTLAHGFSDWTPGNSSKTHLSLPKEIIEEFGRVAEVILIALETLKSSFEVRTAARASISRLMGVLGADMLPLLPRWINGLLSECSSKEEIALFLRLLDQVIFGHKKDIYSVLDSLLTPLLRRVFERLSEPVTGTDDEIQLASLRREYLMFIQVILNNELGGVLISELNQGFFEQLIISITNLARTITNSTASIADSRLAFSVITLMVQLWGGPNIATPGNQYFISSSPSQPLLPGFDRFLMERFHPICFEVLHEPRFKPTVDAQCKQVLNEISGLEQTIYTKTGDNFIHYLQQEFFPEIGIDGSGFIKVLKESPDRKHLIRFLQDFSKQKRND